MKFKMNRNEWEIREISDEEMRQLTKEDAESYTQGTTEYEQNVITINKTSPDKRKALYHELMHCFMYEYGHNQWNRDFEYEDICEISACSHDIIHEIVEEYFKDKEGK